MLGCRRYIPRAVLVHSVQLDPYLRICYVRFWLCEIAQVHDDQFLGGNKPVPRHEERHVLQ